MTMKVNLKMHSMQSHEEGEGDELWAISYGDMITLLLSFFVIFFTTDTKKIRENKIDDHFISSFNIKELIKKSPFPETIKHNDAPKFELLKNAKITKIGDRLLVTFENMNFFNTSETEPNAQGAEMLTAFAAKFLPYTSLYKVNVKAFTDNRPVKGSHRYKDNLELSSLRAIAALRILQKSGIPLNKLEIAGYGEMDRLKSLMPEEKLKKLTNKELNDISRTLVIIIKHDNEQSVL